MKSSWKVAIVLLLAVVFVWWHFSGGGAAAPETRFAKHLDNLCDIAGDNIDKPLPGINKVFRYYGKHGPDWLKSFGDILVEIEKQKTDEAHDRRAEKARDRMWAPLLRCEETFTRFFEAVDNDPAASQRVDQAFERFSRGLEIIFQSGSRQARTWLEQFDFGRRALSNPSSGL